MPLVCHTGTTQSHAVSVSMGFEYESFSGGGSYTHGWSQSVAYETSSAFTTSTAREDEFTIPDQIPGNVQHADAMNMYGAKYDCLRTRG